MKIKLVNLILLLVAFMASSAFTPTSAVRNETVNEIEELSVIGGAYLVFAGKMGGEITRSEIQGVKSLGVDGCARGSRIFSYRLEIMDGGKTEKFTGTSQGLTSEMINALTKLGKGDSFEFKSMKAYLPNGKDEVDVHSSRFLVV